MYSSARLLKEFKEEKKSEATNQADFPWAIMLKSSV